MLVFVQHDLRIGCHVGLQFAAGIVDAYAHFKGGYVIFLYAERSNLGYLAVKDAIAEALHFNARRLSHIHVRDIGFIDFALHVYLVHIAFRHHQRGRRTEHEDGTHRIAHLHITRQDFAIHRRHNGGVA